MTVSYEVWNVVRGDQGRSDWAGRGGTSRAGGSGVAVSVCVTYLLVVRFVLS